MRASGVMLRAAAGLDAARRASALAFALVLALGAQACATAPRDAALPPGDPVRGAAVFAIAGGCGCHTPGDGPVGAGGAEIPTPFGTFYSTNLTSDREHGLGAWSDAEIERAIRRGERRDGSVESPVMPYYRYAGMADRDVRDLVAYLRGLPASPSANRPSEGELPLPRLAYRGWRLLFAGHASPPAEAPAAGVERGAYLARHVAICGDCHTPRNRFGASIGDQELAGVSGGGPLPYAPNVTPDRAAGIGDWDVADIENLLATGFTPEYDNVQGEMARVIDGLAGGPGFGSAPAADRAAIAAWMKTLPPMSRAVTKDGSGPAGATAPAATEEKPA
ncbi:MAG: hypothetical protein RL698_1620 [Pseudomonadota bacterium]|jgi:mono/diheme cytochrome c family protein